MCVCEWVCKCVTMGSRFYIGMPCFGVRGMKLVHVSVVCEMLT